MKLSKTRPERFGAMFMADGEFMCADCVKANASYIDDAATNGDTHDTWRALGYCGDYYTDGMVVNNPEAGDRCCNCHEPMAK